MTQKQQLSWIGLQVQDCIVDRLVGEGTYSWVYSGGRVDGEGSRAFKMAKPPEFIETPESRFGSRARAIYTGGSMDFVPDAGMLLKDQFEKLKATSDPAIVQVREMVAMGETSFYDMELLEGSSLRELMQQGPLPMQRLIAVSDAMARLSAIPAFGYHGDLKPDNIIFQGSELKLIDPGFFGALSGKEGNFRKVAVTTMIYYPTLKPQDLFAFGLMLWEIACKRHPLATDIAGGASKEIDTGGYVPPPRELDKLVKRYRATGNFNFNNFTELDTPRAINPDIFEKLEAVILRCMGMRVVDNRLELGDAYTSFSDVSAALTFLLKAGIEQIG